LATHFASFEICGGAYTMAHIRLKLLYDGLYTVKNQWPTDVNTSLQVFRLLNSESRKPSLRAVGNTFGYV